MRERYLFCILTVIALTVLTYPYLVEQFYRPEGRAFAVVWLTLSIIAIAGNLIAYIRTGKNKSRRDQWRKTSRLKGKEKQRMLSR
ncbi:hypothetical protein G4V62_08740 [Bacillaceae bacterium SIJ1]|uniref:hypothetical protein n=1 Tax=Litoribacterium kuwaitense TaxID=1398745 RepID=UPI0013ED7A04|nr:hypothetical protein [Litoribacterium kuwaitense]NGP45040.1 hypothetical protein [Litoribacterium kuwaitense]